MTGTPIQSGSEVVDRRLILLLIESDFAQLKMHDRIFGLQGECLLINFFR